MQITVIIPTHNPRPGYLQRVLDALRTQTLPLADWELVIVDNASRQPVAGLVDLAWHPAARVIREERLGLTAARLAGFAAARGDIIVLVDDDNALAADYLAAAAQIGRDCPHLACWSGRVELVFEPGVEPPPVAWQPYLTQRHCTEAKWSNDPAHIDSTPWGAGMCLRRSLADAYRRRSEENPDLLRLDLSGTQLVYGGDTDIAYHGCKLGFGMGVFPQLHVHHLIPPERCERAYLLRVIEGRAYSEWLHHWVLHKAVPAGEAGWPARARQLVRWILGDADTRAHLRARRRGHARAVRDLADRR
ncbi:MAG TPA: glycosyltransferase [Lacunisphaera sp.]|nr:glycosyltransferase [Lacunisphaera sp.]